MLSRIANRRIIPLRTFTAADLASSDSDSADFTSIWTVGIIPSGDMLCFARYNKRAVETTEILKEVIRQMGFYKCYAGFIEKNRYESIMKTCRRLVEKGFYGDPLKIKRIISKIKLIPHYGDTKEDRIISTVQPMHKSHSLWFPHGWNEVQDMFALYPAVAHDDDLDVLEMLITHGSAPKNKLINAGNDVALSAGKQSLSVAQQRADTKYNIWTGVRHAVGE
jgi:hypothetical protein